MNKMKNAEKLGTRKFVLWREVVMAYVSPALMAGIGGLITGDRGLQLGALTTIGGTSALIALMLGLWLRTRGGSMDQSWMLRVPHLLVVVIFGLGGGMLGLVAAWAISDCLSSMISIGHMAWVQRIPIDFPLSGVIASVIITWRWRKTVKSNRQN
ncbi:hypothetical protein [Paenibacillus tuaregi]|uniref:hypothetical protein n=1 Tax=Paenibacillus tuaregi TaxID=1816681 RepID=UPI000839A9DD|nr:hypothetical protein [Paenibacillus tuaregi]